MGQLRIDMAPINPQVLSNYLAIIFGIIASVGTLFGIAVSIYQYRRRPFPTSATRSADIEIEPTNHSQTRIDPSELRAEGQYPDTSSSGSGDDQRLGNTKPCGGDTAEEIEDIQRETVES